MLHFLPGFGWKVPAMCVASYLSLQCLGRHDHVTTCAIMCPLSIFSEGKPRKRHRHNHFFFGANLSKLFAWHLSITGHMEPRMQRMQRRMQRSKDNHPTMAPVLPEDQWKEDLKISWFQTQILPHTAADRFGRYLTMTYHTDGPTGYHASM